MGAASGHELSGGGSSTPVVPLHVRHPQVECLGKEGAGGDAAPGPGGGPGLAMALEQHDSPGGVQLGDGSGVEVSDEDVEEVGEMLDAVGTGRGGAVPGCQTAGCS